MAAYVYVIEEEPHLGESSGPWTKIGYSKNPPEWRMEANLKRGNPRSIRIAEAFVFESEQQARNAERSAHRHFADRRHQKEWFRVSSQDVVAWMVSTGAQLRPSQDVPVATVVVTDHTA